MVDAEWLLKSHRELLGVEKALQRRIKQLKMDDNENDVIESMELGTIQEAGMPRAQSRFGSKTERAASDFRREGGRRKDSGTGTEAVFGGEAQKGAGEPETL